MSKNNHMNRSMRIRARLTAELAPTYVSLTDESAKHMGHAGIANLTHSAANDDGTGDTLSPATPTETHFSLEISALKLNGVSRIKQHQMIYDLIKEEFSTGLHSLRIKII